MHQTGAIEVAAIADPLIENARAAAAIAPGAVRAETLDVLLDSDLDALVIATPSAQHAEQAIKAFDRGLAVFCQKPLGRSESEARAVVEAARSADRLLGVDLSYRATQGMQEIRGLLDSGALGRVFAIDLVFHNAYGPDKAWFYDPSLSGGGCVMDLGVHLVDLALWALDFPEVFDVSSSLFVKGAALTDRRRQVEDYAVASVRLGNGAAMRLACSWHLQAGCDAIISASFHGTDGGAILRNIDGSFYDFIAERYSGTTRGTLSAPPDDWGGRTAANWAKQLVVSRRFDPAAERYVDISRVLDRIYSNQTSIVADAGFAHA